MARMKKWRSKEVTQQVAQNMAEAMGEFGLRVEGYSKKELQKGHGVLYGTLRRSIHTAQPGYNWSQDSGKTTITGKREKGSSFTLGGKMVSGLIQQLMKIAVQVGSGLIYALAIHQGWPSGYKNMRGSFAGYHYITKGLEQAKPELPVVLRKHRLKGKR